MDRCSCVAWLLRSDLTKLVIFRSAVRLFVNGLPLKDMGFIWEKRVHAQCSSQAQKQRLGVAVFQFLLRVPIGLSFTEIPGGLHYHEFIDCRNPGSSYHSD